MIRQVLSTEHKFSFHYLRYCNAIDSKKRAQRIKFPPFFFSGIYSETVKFVKKTEINK